MGFKERYLAFAALQIAPVAGSPERTLERFREQVLTEIKRLLLGYMASEAGHALPS